VAEKRFWAIYVPATPRSFKGGTRQEEKKKEKGKAQRELLTTYLSTRADGKERTVRGTKEVGPSAQKKGKNTSRRFSPPAVRHQKCSKNATLRF